jgi:hypothetical protein
MSRRMIDTTHNGLPAALSTIRALPAGNLVALYDTGSGGIAATAADIAEIPTNLTTVFIDQGFTGSPNIHATVRDCENGAWQLEKAVNKSGWNVPRPTLYVGFPNTVQEAYNLGWRGDVWTVRSSPTAPTSPPNVPPGINVVGTQWNFSNPNFDESVIYDNTWPEAKVTTPAQPTPTVPPFNVQTNWAWCHKCQGLFYKPGETSSVCPAGSQHDGSLSGNYLILDIT